MRPPASTSGPADPVREQPAPVYPEPRPRRVVPTVCWIVFALVIAACGEETVPIPAPDAVLTASTSVGDDASVSGSTSTSGTTDEAAETLQIESEDDAAGETTLPAITASTVSSTSRSPDASTEASAGPSTTAVPGAVPASAPPAWLGSRTLPTTADGVVVPQTTPSELVDRRLITTDTLPAPPDDTFRSTIEPVPADVLARSTWQEGCPVEASELTYLTLSFWGFDGRTHTGEMIVNATVADDIVSVFAALHEARFPIEEMRVTALSELDAEPTGDGNNTTAFVCRAVVGGSRFSQHAYGLAVDVNPFHNPYRKGDLVLPELSTSYLDRTERPGVIQADGPVVEAFIDIGWFWGGAWNSLDDYHHFSWNNR